MEFLKSNNLRKLDNQNFELWLDQIKTVYQALEISSILKDDQDATDKVDEKSTGKGLMLIKSTIDDTAHRYILDCSTVPKAIEKLRQLYGKQYNMYELDGEFNRLRWKDGMKAEIFINQLNDIKSKMLSIDKNVSDDRFIRKLMDNCPKSIKYITNTYEKDLALNQNVKLDELSKVIILAMKKQNDKQREQHRIIILIIVIIEFKAINKIIVIFQKVQMYLIEITTIKEMDFIFATFKPISRKTKFI